MGEDDPRRPELPADTVVDPVEQARRLVSQLQGLINAVHEFLARSRELLARLAIQDHQDPPSGPQKGPPSDP